MHLRPYKLLVLSAIVLLMAAGCTKDDAPADGQGATEAVEFEASTSLFQTRGIINATSDLQSFSVFAYYTAATPWANLQEQTPNFMNNQQVVQRTAVPPQWTYSPVKYWPNNTDEMLTFFAYAPYNGTGIIATTNASHEPIINYTWTPTNDLLYDNKQKDKTKQAVNEKVPFVFYHAVAQVEFKVRRKEQNGSPITLNSLTVNSNANTGGTFNLATATWSNQTGSNAQPLNYSPSPTLTVTGYDDATAQSVGASIMIPGTWNLQYTIDYTIGSDNYTPTATALAPIEMEMNKKYTVVFIIDGDVVESYVLREREAEQW